MENTEEKICQNCGAVFHGNYCHECGQKEIQPDDRKLKHFIEIFFSSLFFADGKVFRSFRALFFKPGEMSRSYIAGARKRYLAPLQMFLFVNLLYFLFPFLSTFNTSLNTQLNRLPYSSYVKEIVTDHLEENNLEYADFRLAYQRKSAQNAKLLLIILVVLQGLSMNLLFINRKRLYFTDFLAASAYFTSAYILGFLIILAGLVIAINAIAGDVVSDFLNFNETIVSLFFMALVLLYLTSFLKRAFQIKTGQAFWKGILVAAFLIPFFHIYRFILFWVTYLMIT